MKNRANNAFLQDGFEHAETAYAVSKVRLDPSGRVTAVLWGKVDTGKNDWTEGQAISPVQDVVKALRGGDTVYAHFPARARHLPARRFIAVAYEGGWETIALDGEPTSQREIPDMARIGA